MPSKERRAQGITSEDQLGSGSAKRATKAVENRKRRNRAALDNVMNTINRQRRAQSTDAANSRKP